MEKNNEQNVAEKMEFNFDLPSVEGVPAAKPRIHQAAGESVCISCEG